MQTTLLFLLLSLSVTTQTPDLVEDSASPADAAALLSMESNPMMISTAPPMSAVDLPLDPVGEVTTDGFTQTVEMLKAAVESKNWFLVAGLALFLLVFLTRNVFLPLLGGLTPEQYDFWLPRISVALSVVPSVALKLVSPQVNIIDLVTTSIGCFVVARGTWTTLKPGLKSIPSVTPHGVTKIEGPSTPAAVPTEIIPAATLAAEPAPVPPVVEPVETPKE